MLCPFQDNHILMSKMNEDHSFSVSASISSYRQCNEELCPWYHKNLKQKCKRVSLMEIDIKTQYNNSKN